MTNAENAAFVKDSMMNTLFELMKEKKYEAITLTEIAAGAGYGRATLYRYFQSKEDMIRYYFEKHTGMFADISSLPVQTKDDYYEIIFRVFSTLKESKEYVKLIMKANLEILYLDFMNKAMAENFERNKYTDSKYASFYFVGALFNVSMEWIRNDCEDSVKKISDMYFAQLFIDM